MRVARLIIRALIVLQAADIAYELAQATGAIRTASNPIELVVIAGLLICVIVLGGSSGQPLSQIAPAADLIALALLAAALAVAYHLAFDPYYLPRHVRIVSEQGWGLVAISVVAGLAGAGAVIAWGSRHPNRARGWLAASLTWAAFAIFVSFAGH